MFYLLLHVENTGEDEISFATAKQSAKRQDETGSQDTKNESSFSNQRELGNKNVVVFHMIPFIQEMLIYMIPSHTTG